jgi:hypothetical protein
VSRRDRVGVLLQIALRAKITARQRNTMRLKFFDRGGPEEGEDFILVEVILSSRKATETRK